MRAHLVLVAGDFKPLATLLEPHHGHIGQSFLADRLKNRHVARFLMAASTKLGDEERLTAGRGAARAPADSQHLLGKHCHVTLAPASSYPFVNRICVDSGIRWMNFGFAHRGRLLGRPAPQAPAAGHPRPRCPVLRIVAASGAMGRSNPTDQASAPFPPRGVGGKAPLQLSGFRRHGHPNLALHALKSANDCP